jgi:DNA sulfur modification protein DndD
MKLIEARIKNFMPYKGDQAIFFPTDAHQNVMLVFGDNMRGKTSFLNTIRWCFFGKALSRGLKEIPAIHIINTDAAKEGDYNVSVFIKFISDGNNYELSRSMFPKKSVIQPKKSEDLDFDLMLRKNGSVLRGDQILHELNQIIPEDIARFFLFDGELLQEYEMLLDSNDLQGKSIKESIEKVLGVPALINAREEISILYKEASKKRTKDSQAIGDLKKYSEQMVLLESEFESLDKDLKNLTSQHKSFIDEKQVLDDDLDKSLSTLATKDRLDSYRNQIKELGKSQESLNLEKKKHLKDAWKDLIQIKLVSYIDELEKRRAEFDSNQKNNILLDSKISDLSKLLSTSQCPTCEQDISDKEKDKISKRLNELKSEINKFIINSEKFTELNAEIFKLHKIKPTGASTLIPNIDEQLRNIALNMVRIESSIEELEGELDENSALEVAKKKRKRDDLIGIIKETESKIKDREYKLSENEKQQKIIATLIEKNDSIKNQKSSKLVNIYDHLKKVFSDSINELRENLKVSVQNLASEAFKKLTTEATYKGLKINENYGLTIVDKDGRDVPQRSAGAEQIVALALIDGLNRTARKSGPIIMDTPLGRLDLKHRENVLKYIPEMAEQVILLVHEGEIKEADIKDTLRARIGTVYHIERVESSQSKLSKE